MIEIGPRQVGPAQVRTVKPGKAQLASAQVERDARGVGGAQVEIGNEQIAREQGPFAAKRQRQDRQGLAQERCAAVWPTRRTARRNEVSGRTRKTPMRPTTSRSAITAARCSMVMPTAW